MNTAESRLRTLAFKREIDYVGTAEIATILGVTTATALRLCHKLYDEGFRAEDGATFVYNEIETRANQMGSGLSGRQPRRYNWFFT
jgi:hypothetical protein